MRGEGQLIDIGGRTLYTRVSGNGPTVVLNSGGGTEGVGAWPAIEPHLAEFATVVCYDRAGIGRSEAPPGDPTAADMVLDLHALLKAVDISTPVVLVGRSLGALPAQLYACDYPSKVAGLVLLDPTPDQLFTTFHAPNFGRAAGRAPRERAQLAGGSTHLEWKRMPESCAQVRRAIEEQRRMPDVPLIVVSAAIRAEMGAAASMAADSLALAHQHIAQRVPRGRLIVAEKGSHRTLASEEPDLIIEAIRSILTGAR